MMPCKTECFGVSLSPVGIGVATPGEFQIRILG